MSQSEAGRIRCGCYQVDTRTDTPQRINHTVTGNVMSTASSYTSVVQELYLAYFGRPADPTGLQNFAAALLGVSAPTTLAGIAAAYSTNAEVKGLINSFATSTESGIQYGTGIAGSQTATQSFVN